MKKPRLTLLQIWNMSVGFFGIQFGFGLQNANVSRIFETLGARIDDIAILWIAAPVTGLIVQPIIGHMSDKTWGKLGRRRPFFLTGALCASLALLVMPNSPVLWVAAGTLWILDASINISMEPFRAFVGDMLPSEQRTVGFSMQSFFIGTGAVIASALPYMMTNWFGISNAALPGEIPASVRFSFYCGGTVFLAAVLWTVFHTKEYSPDELAKYSDMQGSQERKEMHAGADRGAASKKFAYDGVLWIVIGVTGSAVLRYVLQQTDYGLYVLFIGLTAFGMLQLLVAWIARKGKTEGGLVIVFNDFYAMPRTMKQLAVVQFFSWFALFAMWIYTTPAVTHHIYGATDPGSELYNRGADWVGVLMAVYNGFAAAMAFVLMWLSEKTNRKTVHMFSLFCGGGALFSFYFIGNPVLLLLPELGIGLAWASILAMPYAILAGSLPPQKMGVYMGIFNFFIVIPQITAAAILGWCVKNVFGGDAIYALLLGGVSMVLAGFFVLRVNDVDDASGSTLPA